MANKYLDYDGLLYLWSKIKGAFVAKESGKGLSTNDYTNAEKTKLSGIATGAQVNVIETVKRNGTALTVTGKAVDVTVPTKTSDITNDSGFITSGDVPTASSTTPKMNGTASVGSETAFARGDHVHPVDTSRASSTHTHGSITNAGAITANAVTPANNDAIVMTDASASGKIVKSNIVFDGATTNQFLTKKGTWASAPTPNADQIGFSSQDIQAESVEEYLLNLSAGKVDKETGKGLSTNDYTTDEKTKLAGIATGAQANVIESVAISGLGTTSSAVSGKTQTITVTLDSSMSSSSANGVQNKVIKKYIDDAIGGITGIDFQVVTSLPTTGVKGTIYLVAHAHGTGDAYDEYIWTGEAYEKIGNTDVDLSGYLKTTDMVAITNTEIDTIVAS